MGVNSLPKTVTRRRRDCDFNPGPSAPESSMLTTRLPREEPCIKLRCRLTPPGECDELIFAAAAMRPYATALPCQLDVVLVRPADWNFGIRTPSKARLPRGLWWDAVYGVTDMSLSQQTRSFHFIPARNKPA